jgi:hypothetical protein
VTQISNYLPISTAPQGVSASGTGSMVATSTNPADYLVEMITDLVIGLEAQTNAGTGTSAATVLPSTTEPATSTAASNIDPSALAAMGDAVGLGMASANTPVNWNDFIQQTTQQFSAAGLRPTDIDTYLGAVMQSYTQNAQAVAPSTEAGLSTSIAVPLPSASTAVVNPATSSAVAATSTSSYAVDPSQLPNTQLDASQFTSLAETAYNQAAPSLGSSININLFVANTQTEMSNDGYSQDQINNYMTGLYTAYNASFAGTLPSSNTATTTVQQPTNDENT